MVANESSQVFSRRLESLKPSPILAMMNKTKQVGQSNKEYRRIHLEVGDPDFETPTHIRESAHRSANQGETHYTSARGIPQLRLTISSSLSEDYGIKQNPDSEIMVSPGSKFALFCALMSLIDESDEVIIPEPAWPAYLNAVRMCGGTSITVPMTKTKDGFALNIQTIKDSITEKTKVLILNSPGNPTGLVLSKQDIAEVNETLRNRADIVVISDEVYSKFMFDGCEHQCLLNSELSEKTILINKLSKTYAMTGWRIGYTVAKKEFIDRMVLVQESISTCAPVFVQKAALAAIEGSQECVQQMQSQYDLRRKIVMESLNNTKVFSPGRPRGGLYLFPSANLPGVSSIELANELFDRLAISTTPGVGFGKSGEGHLRISLTCPTSDIKEAMSRINNFYR